MTLMEYSLNEARREGRQEGRQEGLEKGLEKGRHEERQEVILNMLQAKTDVSFISKVTGLPKAEIIKFKNGKFKNGKAE